MAIRSNSTFFYALLLCVFSLATPVQGTRIFPELCGTYFGELAGDKDMLRYVQRLSEFTGNRLIQEAPGQFRNRRRLSSLRMQFSGFEGGQKIEIRLTQESSPRFEIDSRSGNRTLFIPKHFDFDKSPDGGRQFFLNALRGHTLHPHTGSERAREERLRLQEPAYLLKPAQVEGAKAAIASLEAGNDFAFIGPTGVGKTHILLSALQSRLQAFSEKRAKAVKHGIQTPIPGLHVVFADEEKLVNQLHDNVQKMETENEYLLYRWGGTHNRGDTPQTIAELVEMSHKTGRPIVLVTTVQSLINRVGRDPNESKATIRTSKISPEARAENLRLLQDNVDLFIVDEMHHVGAPQTLGLLDGARGVTRTHEGDIHREKRGHSPKILGLTATPIRKDMGVINDVFHGHAFWAYLDNAKDYLQQPGSADRSEDEILKQLIAAVESGEAHPFSTYFINPQKFGVSTDELFVEPTGKGQRAHINPAHYDAYFEGIRPIIEKNDHLFFACTSIDEAERMKAFVEKAEMKRPSGRKHKVGVLHSKLKPVERDAIWEAFEKGEISALFTVDMLNEGIDIRTLSAYIDTNRNTPLKELLQRTGRTLRLAEGKIPHSDIVSFQEITEPRIADLLLQLQKAGGSKWEITPGGESSPNNGAEPNSKLGLRRVLWSPQDIEATRHDLVEASAAKRAKESEQARILAGRRAAELFDEIVAHLRKKPHTLTWKERQLDGIQNLDDRPLHNKLLRQFSDSKADAEALYAVAQEKRGSESLVDKTAAQSIQEALLRMESLEKNLGSKQGVLSQLATFYDRNHRLPQAVSFNRSHRVAEEVKLAGAMLIHLRDPDVLRYALPKMLPQEQREHFDRWKAFLEAKENTPALLKMLAEHQQSRGDWPQMPPGPKPSPGNEAADRQAVDRVLAEHWQGLIGRLEKEARQSNQDIEDRILELDPPEPLFGKLVERAHEASLQKAAIEPVLDRPSDPGKLRTRSSSKADAMRAFIESPQWQNSPKRPQPKNDVELNLDGPIGGVAELVEMYKAMQKQFGFALIERGEPEVYQNHTAVSRRFVLRTTDPASKTLPSDVLAFEQGKQVLVYEKSGQRYTNEVLVTVEGSEDPAPKPINPKTRTIALYLTPQSITDERLDREQRKAAEKSLIESFASTWARLAQKP